VASYLVSLIWWVVTIITIVLILNALISFTPLEPWHPVRRVLNQLAEPIVRPFRNILPPTGMIDFTPMIALIVVQIVGQILIALVRSAFR
jgi:YggT family protein